MKATVAQRRRVASLQAVLLDPGAAAGEKANAAGILSDLYRKCPDLAEIQPQPSRPQETPAPAPPPRITRQHVEKAARVGLNAAEQAGLIKPSTGNTLREILRDVMADWERPPVSNARPAARKRR